MRWVSDLFVILGGLALLIGLGIRLIHGGFLTEPLFYWRGSVALLLVAIAVVLIQIRNK